MWTCALALLLLQTAPADDVRAGSPGPHRFAGPATAVDLGADARHGFGSDESFTITLGLRTTAAEFATVVMCREGEAVHYSLVLGRRPGVLSCELWSWREDQAIGLTRVDDGRWHEVTAAYDAPTAALGLWLDGRLETRVPVHGGFAKTARPLLRLGNNIGCDQPFQGELARVVVRAGVAAKLRAELAEHAALRVLPEGQAAAAMTGWLERMRAPRDPAPDHAAAETLRIQAQVQDALGLWPPPYAPGAADAEAWPSPLMATDGAVPKPTAFARLRPTLPLDVRAGGQLARPGYTVTRIDWQTFAGHRARGFLYRPTAASTGKRAAVLCPHGHWDTGNRHHVVQARCLTLARLGYVVLTVDAEHVDDDPIGLSSAGLMAWNNLRGLELLRALPDVDPERIGCTGASGGGLQTMHLMALDAGLAAAAPAVMACHFDEILRSDVVHCRCNFTPRMSMVGDQPQMCAAFAPGPTLFLSVTGDWTHAFPVRGYPPLARLWGRLGAADRIASRQWEGGHDFNRPMRNAVYAFFEHWLHGVAAPGAELEPSEAQTEPPEVLAGLERPGAEQDLAAVAREFRARLAAPPVAADPRRVAARRERLAQLFAERGPAPKVQVRSRAPVTVAGQALEAVALADGRDPGILLPLLVLRPDGRATGWAIVIGEGKQDQFLRRRPWLAALDARGLAVVLADVRYTGELDQGRLWREPYGRLSGLEEGVLAVRDVRSVLAALPLLDPAVPARATLLAFGVHGAAAVYAAAVDERVERVIVPDLGPTYAAADRQPRMARVLRHGDLPDAAALLAPRALVAGGVLDLAAYAGARACHGGSAATSLQLSSAVLEPEILAR